MILPSDDTTEIKELIETIQGRDTASFRRLYELYSGKMFSLCLRYAGNSEDAHYLLQEGFIRLYHQIASYRHEGSFEGWVRRIFVNTCINELQNRNVIMEDLHLSNKTDSAELSGIDNLSMVDTLRLIQQLPAGCRTILNLHLVEGYSHKEIGEILGMAESGSESGLYRAKQLFRKMLISNEKN